MAKRQLRLRLRGARLNANLTQFDLAEKVGWSQSKVLRLENGQTPYQLSDVLALLSVLPDLVAHRDELTELAKDARKPTITSRYADVLTPQFGDWLEHEAYAAVIRQYENQFVPGVLQTDAYATGIVKGLLGSGADENHASQIVDARTERAEPLLGPDGPKMEFVIDEAALRRAVGNEDGRQGFATMIDQLRHLQHHNTVGRRGRGETIEAERNPQVAIQIVPSTVGAYPAMRGPFEVAEFPGDDTNPMVYFEYPDGDEVVRDEVADIARYLDMFTDLKKLAPTPAETNDRLEMIITELQQTSTVSPVGKRVRRSATPTAGPAVAASTS